MLDSKVKLVRKADSAWMRFLARFMNKDFMTRFWTTNGDTIYVPSQAASEPDYGSTAWENRHRNTLAHEYEHVQQFRHYGSVLFTLLYMLAPVPVLLAYFRWRFEREAYMHNLRAVSKTARSAQVEYVIQSLWNNYFWPWPRNWMRDWFMAELKREDTTVTRSV